jgi:hypothetical protein
MHPFQRTHDSGDSLTRFSRRLDPAGFRRVLDFCSSRQGRGKQLSRKQPNNFNDDEGKKARSPVDTKPCNMSES